MKDSAKHVIVISPLPPPPGGIATWTRAILNYAESREDVVLHHVDSRLRMRAPTDERLWTRLVSGVVDTLCICRMTQRALRRESGDVVHLCSAGFFLSSLRDLLLLRKAKKHGLRTVIHWRTGLIPQIAEQRGWHWRILSAVGHYADDMIVLDSQSYRTLSAAMPSRRIHQIPNPVNEDVAAFANTVEQVKERRILFVGYVLPTKGIRELIDACIGIPQSDFELHLIGPCEQGFAQELRQSAAKREGTWLHLRGPLEHRKVLHEMAAAGVIVLPSYFEGFPNVILEAMTLGRAVVASAVGAIPEMLTSDAGRPCGICVPPKNVAALREALRALLESPNLQREYGLRARDRALAEYSMSGVFDRYVACWRAN